MSRTPEATAALKSYVYFAEAQGGVYFGGGTEHFLISGAGIYPLVSRLVSLLDGSRSIEAIHDGLPVKARSFFGVLIGELRNRQMLRECLPSSDNISDEEWRLYRETLLYLRDRTAGFASLFRTWRTRDNIVIGGGVCAKALLRGLARTSAGRIRFLHDPSVDGSQPAELVRVLEEHQARDMTFSYAVIDAAQNASGADSRLIYASDQLRIGAHAGLHFAGGFLKGQAIVAGGGDADCDTILRDLGSRIIEGQAGGYSAVTAPSIIGNLLAFEILRADVAAFTNNSQTASVDAGHFLHLSPGGEVTTHRLPQTPPRVTAPAERQDTGFDLFDPLVGVFERLPALAGHRLPLPHARVRLRLPDGAAIEEVIWGVKQGQAESDVVLKAAARYAALTKAGRFIAAPSREAWMPMALASAIVDSPLFKSAETRTVTLEHFDDAEFHFLARIARLYSAERPAITLTSADDWPAFIAEARVGPFTARAISPCSIEAISNALGQACSQMQLAEAEREPEPMLATIRAPLVFGDFTRAPQTVSSDACIRLLARAGFLAIPFLHPDPIFVSAGIHVGAMEIVAIGASS